MIYIDSVDYSNISWWQRSGNEFVLTITLRDSIFDGKCGVKTCVTFERDANSGYVTSGECTMGTGKKFAVVGAPGCQRQSDSGNLNKHS